MTSRQVPESDQKTGKPIKSTDPRKPIVMAALKKASNSGKVTTVREVAPGVFQGDCMRKPPQSRRYVSSGTWEVSGLALP